MYPSLPSSGYITTFQSPTTQLRSIPNRNSQGKNFIKCSQSSFLLPNKISRNSEYLKNRNNKSLKKYCVPDTSQDGYASKSEDDNNLTSFRDDLQKNLIALYRFSRPHTVIGTVSLLLSKSLIFIFSREIQSDDKIFLNILTDFPFFFNSIFVFRY